MNLYKFIFKKKNLRLREKKDYLENLWRTQHKRKENWTKIYFDSWRSSYRQEFVKRLKGYDFDSLIDLGCNSGPNLKALREAGINADLYGIDINEEAILYGKSKLPDVNLEVRSLYEMKGRYDVVIACAVLQHIPPDGIHKVLELIFKTAKKRVTFIDMHQFHALGSVVFQRNKKYWDRFPRNWWELLKPYAAEDRISISELPNGGASDIYDANAIIDIVL